MELNLRKAIWLAPLAWSIHETEEWNIDSFARTHFVEPRSLASIDHHVLWIQLGIVALNGVVWKATTAWPKNPRFTAMLTLPFFVYFSFGNPLQHLCWAAYFRTFAPGVITAVLLVMPIFIGLTVKALRPGLLLILTLASTVLTGSRYEVLPWPIKV